MIARSEAEEHLRIIRSLMENATIYRALSAPAALVGGILSLAASACVFIFEHRQGGTSIPSTTFTAIWSVVFFATVATSLLLIKRDADRRGEPFLSNGSRSAFRAMFPAMLVAGALTLASFARDTVPQQVPWWIALYGVALLGMWHFAPRSIVVLGWAFTVAGTAALCGFPQALFSGFLSRSSDVPSILMAATFGLFHLIYAACTWPRPT